MLSLFKKIVHETTKPFTDSGPFGAGPAFSGQNPRSIAKAIYDINARTWTPSRALRSDTARQMGERFPMLAVSPKTDKSFGEWLETAVKRIDESRNMEQAILHVFGWRDGTNFDDQRFLKHLENPALAEAEAHPGQVIGAVQYIARSDASGVELSASDWDTIVEKYAYVYLNDLDRDAFAQKIDDLRNGVDLGADPDRNDLE